MPMETIDAPKAMPNQKQLLKNLAIGFLPLMVFIVADALWGTTVGLVVAVIAGMGEALRQYLRDGTVDRFILFDTGLIVLLGGISVILHNAIFFKLKPVLVELIMAILIGLTAFTPNDLLIRMTGRYLKGVQFNEVQLHHMRRMMRGFFWLVVIHICLTLYAAFAMSTAAWGFVSGGLFYILVGTYAVAEIVRSRWQQRKIQRQFAEDEWFDIVQPDGKIIGRAPRSAVHGNPQLLHPVVHLHILNHKGDLLLQKRSTTKDLYGGFWDTAVGGHVRSGETVEAALRREAEEELGITPMGAAPVFQYVHRNAYESELVFAFLLREEGPFYPNTEEIDEVRFWTFEEIESQLGKEVFTPNFEQEFQLLKQVLGMGREKTKQK